MIPFNNLDLRFDIDKIKSFDNPITVSKSFDENLCYPYALDVQDITYWYAEEKERNDDYKKLVILLNLNNKSDFMEHKEICIKWSTVDVIEKAKEMDIDNLSIYEASIILDKIEHCHDAEIGINWDVIAFHIQDYLDSVE